MITVVSATNRPGNRTSRFAAAYYDLLSAKGLEVRYLDLGDLPDQVSLQSLFDYQNSPFSAVVEKFLQPAEKWVLLVPEYNGGYPGILKLLIDSMDPEVFFGKKIALVGVSSGRSGNLRGIESLTGVFHYLSAEVYSFKVPVSRADTLMDTEGKIIDGATISAFDRQIRGFVNF